MEYITEKIDIFKDKDIREEDEKMFKYFLIGFESVWEMALFRYVSILLIGVMILLCLRRLSVVWKSGGSFFAPYHIGNGNLYIHNAVFFGKRIISLSEIKRIQIHCFHGRKGGGRRYLLQIEKKHGRASNVIFGKSKKTNQMVGNLQKETKKYGIKIHKGLWH